MLGADRRQSSPGSSGPSPYADVAARDPATVDVAGRVRRVARASEDHAQLVDGWDGRWTGGDPGRGGDLAARGGVCWVSATGDVLHLRSQARHLPPPRALDAGVRRHLGGQTRPTSGGWPSRWLLAGALVERLVHDLAARWWWAWTSRAGVRLALAEPLNAEWRAIPRVDGFTPESIAAVEALVDRHRTAAINAALPFSNQDAGPSPGCPEILASVDRSVLVNPGRASCCCSSSSACSPATRSSSSPRCSSSDGGPRRRSCGPAAAGSGTSCRMALGEALLVTVPAVLAAPWGGGAAGLRRSGSTRRSREWASRRRCLGWSNVHRSPSSGGVLAILALTIPTLALGRAVSLVSAPRSGGRLAGRCPSGWGWTSRSWCWP